MTTVICSILALLAGTAIGLYVEHNESKKRYKILDKAYSDLVKRYLTDVDIDKITILF
jgi:hypothetical protein